MDTARLLEEVEAEISRLQKVADLLREGSTTTSSASKGKGKGKGKRKPMSAAAREKIAAAQRARWAKTRKAAKKAAKPTS
jgi:hypothetical protein